MLSLTTMVGLLHFPLKYLIFKLIIICRSSLTCCCSCSPTVSVSQGASDLQTNHCKILKLKQRNLIITWICAYLTASLCQHLERRFVRHSILLQCSNRLVPSLLSSLISCYNTPPADSFPSDEEVKADTVISIKIIRGQQ